MAIYSGNYYLSLSQMTENAKYIFNYLLDKGWSKNAICGMLGNMQRESSINPGIWQNLDEGNTSLGIGLVQWTPASKYINWCNSNSLDYTEMDSNLKRILWELENNEQYIQTSDYPLSFTEYTKSTKDVEYLASAFLYNYERAGVTAEAERRANALYWYEILEETISFVPRLTSEGIAGSYYWNEGSPFYPNYVLPNCTCYAWGRFWEIGDLYDGVKDYSNRPSLYTGNAGNWFGYTGDGYERGNTPKLGAVICWSDDDGGAGHVGIVEKIDDNGNITVSQSAYGGSYFYTSTLYKSNNYSFSHYTFQGFIYNPYSTPIAPIIPDTKKKKKKFNWILFNPRRRLRI